MFNWYDLYYHSWYGGNFELWHQDHLRFDATCRINFSTVLSLAFAHLERSGCGNFQDQADQTLRRLMRG